MEERPIVLETKVIRPANQGATTKQEDSIMNKLYWTREECDLLAKICDYYLETRWSYEPEESNNQSSVELQRGVGLDTSQG